ncbi:SNF2-related protein [Massilia sp. DWR3-1-1]|uniref:DEAD/DEAH box helicase n=1 Tax=Massilia sp. DWR3-1-1 TaxID=2804559 RepID=UPI003CEA7430
MHLTIDDLGGQFDPATFTRGDSYARQGMVLDVREHGSTLAGTVRGSGAQVYRQHIIVRERRHGVSIDGECSCPMFHNCKHVLAVLLVHLQQSAHTPAGAARRAQQWLDQLAQALAPASAAPAGATYRLAYALTPDAHSGTPCLNLCKARLRKDGSVASATVISDLYDLLAAPPNYVKPADEEAIRLVAALRAGRMFSDDIPVTGRLGARLLQQLCADGLLIWAATRADLNRGAALLIGPGAPRQGLLDWQADGDAAAALALQWRFDDGAPVGHVLATTPMLYLDGQLLGELQLPSALAALAPATLLRLVEQAPPLPPGQGAAMATRLLEQGFDRIVPLPQALKVRRRKGIAPVPHLLLSSVATPSRTGLQWHDYAQLSFHYDGIEAPADGSTITRRAGTTVEIIARAPGAEAALVARLAALGFTGAGPAGPLASLGTAIALPDGAAWLAFARHQLPQLRADGWHIVVGGDYRYEVLEVDDWYAELDEDDDQDGGVDNAWFSLELGIVVEGERHALLPLLLQMMRHAPADFDAAALAARDDDDALVVALPDARRVALPWQRIKPILATLIELHLGERSGKGVRLPLIDAARLAELEAAAQLRWVGGERLRALARKMHAFDGILPVAVPAGLQAQLRPYQHAGLSWMQFLREYGFGGILADDMGLGKTVQTLAHILAEKEAGRLDRPALVVAPTSLMGNWQSEAARFTPGLRVLLLHGKERAALFAQIAEADLVLTTYPLLGRDEALLRQHRFHLLILDEAQTIKNSRAKASQAARLLEARHRLCLTGTPVQNHLGELWSQFHFLMPGLLGDERSFNAQLRKPIELHGDSHAQQALARRIKPFMLRRTKDKVATELPPKTEIMLPVEFGAAQRDLYETVRVAMDRKVRDEIDRRGLARSQIVILDALLKLRQVCCDPRLLKNQASTAGSAKLDTLMDLLDTLLSEGRKVLVFSQFTSMLALIGAQLRERAVDFALLTGDTQDRAAPVAAFQGGQVAVFLISLKAGGVGLNLTAADTVIHYDPWWNPASENQATDRAWRIGQTQPVFVYKLIARGTLEEKIQEMQRRKADLANAVLDPASGLAGRIDAADLQAIFSLSAA